MNETIAKSIVFLSGGVEQYDELRKNGNITVDGVTHIYDKERNIYVVASNTATVNELLEKVYPVGSIYMSINDNSPENFLGGTWERIEDKFLLSAGTSHTAGSEGGSADAVVVSHTHNLSYIKSGTGGITSDGTMVQKGYAGDDWGNASTTTNDSTLTTVGEDGTGKNMPPYLAVYMWKRTA